MSQTQAQFCLTPARTVSSKRIRAQLLPKPDNEGSAKINPNRGKSIDPYISLFSHFLSISKFSAHITRIMAAVISLSSPCFRLSSSFSSLSRRNRFRTRTRNLHARQTRFPRMVFNGAPAGNTRISGKIYRRLDSCLVIPPPAGRKPRAIIKFIGGAFIGATPEVTYG